MVPVRTVLTQREMLDGELETVTRESIAELTTMQAPGRSRGNRFNLLLVSPWVPLGILLEESCETRARRPVLVQSGVVYLGI